MGPGTSFLPRLRPGHLHLSSLRLPPRSTSRSHSLRFGPIATKDPNRNSQSHVAGRRRTPPTHQLARPSPQILLRHPNQTSAPHISAFCQSRRAFLGPIQKISRRSTARCVRLRRLPHHPRSQTSPENNRTGAEAKAHGLEQVYYAQTSTRAAQSLKLVSN